MKPLNDRKMRWLAEHCRLGSILDVGCAARPNPHIANAVGLDIVPADSLPGNYERMLLCDLNTDAIPAPDGSFQNVLAGDFIEHIENPSHFLREANRVLIQDGRLVLSTPQANDWWVTLHNWFFRRWINDPDPGEHLQNWTILDMTRLLKKNGFGVERVEGLYFQTPYLPIRIRTRRFPSLAWQVIYIAKKVSDPDSSVMVMEDGKRAAHTSSKDNFALSDQYISKDFVIRGSLVDLTDAERIWDDMDKRIRTSVRKGEQMGVKIRPFDGSSEELETLKAFTPNDDDIPASLESRHHAYVAVAEDTGELLGWILLAGVGRKLFMLCHASTEEGKRRQTPNLLIWHAIKSWEGKAYRYLDIGASYRPSLQKYFEGFRQLDYPAIFRPPSHPDLRVSSKPFTSSSYAVEQGDPEDGRRKLMEHLGTDKYTFFPDERCALRAVLRELKDQGMFSGGKKLLVITDATTVPDYIERAARENCEVTKEASSAGAVLITHELGFPNADAAQWRSYCDEQGIPLIEDLSEGWGSEGCGIGDIRIYSISNLLPIRYGAIATGITISFERMWHVHACSDQGKERDIYASIATLWRPLDSIRSVRRNVWDQYKNNLESISDPAIDLGEGVMPYAYPAKVSDDARAEEIVRWLRKFNVDAYVWHGKSAVLLPCHQSMSRSQVDYVSGAFLAQFREGCGIPAS